MSAYVTVTCPACDGRGHTVTFPIEVCTRCAGYGKIAVVREMDTNYEMIRHIAYGHGTAIDEWESA